MCISFFRHKLNFYRHYFFSSCTKPISSYTNLISSYTICFSSCTCLILLILRLLKIKRDVCLTSLWIPLTIAEFPPFHTEFTLLTCEITPFTDKNTLYCLQINLHCFFRFSQSGKPVLGNWILLFLLHVQLIIKRVKNRSQNLKNF